MQLYSQVEAASAANVSTGTLNTAIRKGLIPEPTIQIGGRRRYYDEDTMNAVVEYFRRRREQQIEALMAKNAARIGANEKNKEGQ